MNFIKIVSCLLFTMIISQSIIQATETEIDPTTLYQALRTGNAQTIQQWIEAGGDVNTFIQNDDSNMSINTQYVTPLFIAAYYGQNDIITELLQRGANIAHGSMNEQSFVEFTPLDAAVSAGNIATVDLLLNNGAEINRTTNDGLALTPLHIAILYDQEEMAQHLIERGARVNVPDAYQMTPLHLAAYLNMPAIIDLLIQRHANLNATDRYSFTPLFYAVITGNLQVVQQLINAYANRLAITRTETTLLHYAADSGNQLSEMPDHLIQIQDKSPQTYADIFNFLIESGLDPQKRNNTGLLSLHAATIANNAAIINQLISLPETNIEAQANDGKTALHFAIEYDSPEVLDLLLSKGANVNVQDTDGLTPLHYAVINENLMALQKILAHNPNPELRDQQHGFTALHNAARMLDGQQFISALSNYDADINAKNSIGDTPLHSAAQTHNEINIQSLIDNGANILAQNNAGQTAGQQSNNQKLLRTENLFNAIQNHATNIREQIITNIPGRVYPFARTVNGLTFMHYAVKYENEEALKILLSVMPDLVNKTTFKGHETPIDYAVGTPMLNVIYDYLYEKQNLAGAKTPEGKKTRSRIAQPPAPYKKPGRPNRRR